MGGGRALLNQGYNLHKTLPVSVTKAYKEKGQVSARLVALFGADLLTAYAMYVMMNYLTNVWNLSITHAAAIINIFDGITSALVIVFGLFLDGFLGNIYMFVLSTIAYIIGLGLLSLSTPTFFGPCSHDKEECIGHKQKVLFFTALPLIAIGIAGHVVSFQSFREKQKKARAKANQEANDRAIAEAEFPAVAPIVVEAQEAEVAAVAIPEAEAPIVAEAQSQSQAEQALEFMVVAVFGIMVLWLVLEMLAIVVLFKTILTLYKAISQEAKDGAAAEAETPAVAPTVAAAQVETTDEVETTAPTVLEDDQAPLLVEAQSQSQADQEEVRMADSFIFRLSSLSIQALRFVVTAFIYMMALGIGIGIAAVILAGLAITFLYVKPWSIQFGVPAICAMIVTVLFLSGHPLYYRSKPKGSPLTIGLRVFVAAATKDFQQVKGFTRTYNDDNTKSTNSLRWLEKAATKFPDQAISKSWTLCTMREVEDTKTGVRMIPVLLTFVGTGLVFSTGNTYFIEQANHMDRRLGKINIPIPFFKLFDTPLIDEGFVTEELLRDGNPARIVIATSMVSSVLCCIIAAVVEIKRLDVIRKHGLLDMSNERIPMTVFYLLPQFLLLGLVRVYANAGLEGYLKDTVPQSMQKYLLYFQKFVLGLGSMANVLLVYVVGKLSEINNKPNWFQHTSNRSRLDLYYWTLAGLSALSLICFIVASSYKRHDHQQEEEHVNG